MQLASPGPETRNAVCWGVPSSTVVRACGNSLPWCWLSISCASAGFSSAMPRLKLLLPWSGRYLQLSIRNCWSSFWRVTGKFLCWWELVFCSISVLIAGRTPAVAAWYACRWWHRPWWWLLWFTWWFRWKAAISSPLSTSSSKEVASWAWVRCNYFEKERLFFPEKIRRKGGIIVFLSRFRNILLDGGHWKVCLLVFAPVVQWIE